MTPEDVHSYPLKSLPLASRDLSGELPQSQKAPYRNYLISKSKYMRYEALTKANLIYDGMTLVWTLSLKTYLEGTSRHIPRGLIFASKQKR